MTDKTISPAPQEPAVAMDDYGIVLTNSGTLQTRKAAGTALVEPGEWVSFMSLSVTHQFSGTVIEDPIGGGRSGRAVCGSWLPDWGWVKASERDRCAFCEAQVPDPNGDGRVYPVPLKERES